MQVIYNLDEALVELLITEQHAVWKWQKDGSYAVAHDPIRGRVGGLLLRQEGGRTVYAAQKGRTVTISVRRIPFYESVRLDRHVTLDLAEDGTVRAVTVEE